MSATDVMLRLLREAGSRGLHTHDLRRRGVTGNPSQRRREINDRPEIIAEGLEVTSTIERRGDRHGARYVLGPRQPAGAGTDDGSSHPPSKGVGPGRASAPVPAGPAGDNRVKDVRNIDSSGAGGDQLTFDVPEPAPGTVAAHGPHEDVDVGPDHGVVIVGASGAVIR